MRRIFALIAATNVAVIAYMGVLRPRHLRWGATDEEVARPMPGDERVLHPHYATTRAVTVQAPPEAIWPWLVQIGYRRGGLYSYDWLDRLFGFLDRPSADRILPEFQDLAVGDVIPLGNGPSWPVQALERPRFLQIGQQEGDVSFTWAFALHPIDERSTRLVSRVRAQMPPSPASVPILIALDPAAFIMERKMLLGIKERAERAASGRNRLNVVCAATMGSVDSSPQAKNLSLPRAWTHP